MVIVVQLHLTLCDPLVCSLPGSSVYGISQARVLGWVAISFSRDLPNSGIEPTSPVLAGGFFTTLVTWEAPQTYTVLYVKLEKLCPADTLFELTP